MFVLYVLYIIFELIFSSQEASEIPIVMVGCGCQQKERRQVSYYTAREFADERHSCGGSM